MNEYYIPEWWYQTFLVIIFAFAVLALVSFIIYKKKVENEIDSLTENSVRLYKENESYEQMEKALLSENSKIAAEKDKLQKENERLKSLDIISEHIFTTVHPIRKFITKCEMNNIEEINDAKSYCIHSLFNNNNNEIRNLIDWRIEKDIVYCRPVMYASLQIVDPGKTQCEHPDKCHECEKILFCNYWR